MADTLICAPWSEARDWIDGTTKSTCTDCTTAIAVAPTGQELLRLQPRT